MDQKEIMALAIISVVGVILVGSIVIFLQYQSSKLAILSSKPASQQAQVIKSDKDSQTKTADEQNNEEDEIKNFQECAAAGNPIMETYPARCSAPDGKTFTEDIGNEMELADLIVIYSPRPNTKISSPIAVSGKARGMWFFEADFPVQLLDDSGNIIASSIAQAQSDWMTEDFVEFLAMIEFKTPPTPTGKLILKKDNPSDLPEHDNQLIVPVKF